jgi:hypothetical protein
MSKRSILALLETKGVGSLVLATALLGQLHSKLAIAASSSNDPSSRREKRIWHFEIALDIVAADGCVPRLVIPGTDIVAALHAGRNVGLRGCTIASSFDLGQVSSPIASHIRLENCRFKGSFFSPPPMLH